ncbi:hypothetical protein ACHAXS_011119 [Conticribra weissflogii]
MDSYATDEVVNEADAPSHDEVDICSGNGEGDALDESERSTGSVTGSIISARSAKSAKSARSTRSSRSSRSMKKTSKVDGADVTSDPSKDYDDSCTSQATKINPDLGTEDNDMDEVSIGVESRGNSNDDSHVIGGEQQKIQDKILPRRSATSTNLKYKEDYNNYTEKTSNDQIIDEAIAEDIDQLSGTQKIFDTVYSTFSEHFDLENPLPRQTLDREILFDDSLNYPPPLENNSEESKKRVQGYTNKLWNLQTNRVLTFTGPVARVVQGRYFFSQDQYVPRILAIYKNPDLIFILRLPQDVDEVRRLLPIQSGHELLANEEMTSLMSSFVVAESVIDTQACKIRLSQLTTCTSVPTKIILQDRNGGRRMTPLSKVIDPRIRSCLEILTPSEVVVLSAVVDSKELPDSAYESAEAVHETRRIEHSICDALFNAYAGKYSDDYSWKHQVVLGTLHSYVISGNNQALKEALVNAMERHHRVGSSHDSHELKYVTSLIIDAKDDDGYTALHLACMKRSNVAVNLLVDSGANCWVPTVAESKTPCHLCAERLDAKSLSIVLSATYPARPDPNALDFLGRTPCYAASQGTMINGKSDPVAMGLCISALEAWGGQLMISGYPDSNKLLHPIHCLSFQWKPAELIELLSHCHYCYPLTNADGSDAGGISLAALYHYPIHAALIALRKHIHIAFGTTKGDFSANSFSSEQQLIRTVQVLLEHGFEPNEKFEGIIGRGSEIKSLSEYFGLTPLHILLLAAKELRSFDKQKQTSGDDCFDTMQTVGGIIETIQACAGVLMKNGARTNVPPPTHTRLDRETPPVCYSLNDAIDARLISSLPKIDRNDLNFGDSVLSLFGGVDRVNSHQEYFAEIIPKSFASVGTVKIQKGLSSTLDSESPGGSDSCSCAICWGEFGVISNRKQFCQVSCRYVCNDCSKKRLKDNGSEYRISDGQFNLCRALAAKERTGSRAKQEEASRYRRFREAQARSSLFKSNSFKLSDKPTKTGNQTAPRLASSMITNLGQTRDAVLERRDKLNSLANKSEALNNASMDFAAMAKELNRQQNSFFGF